jgi:hypothetical protein
LVSREGFKGAMLDDLAVVHDKEELTGTDCGDGVRDDDGCSTFRGSSQSLADHFAFFWPDCRASFVQNHYLGILDQASCNSESLDLARLEVLATHTTKSLKTRAQNHIIFKLCYKELFKTSNSSLSEPLFEIISSNCLFDGTLEQSVETHHTFQRPYLCYCPFECLAVELKRLARRHAPEVLFRLISIVCVVLRLEPGIELPFPFNSYDHIIPFETCDILTAELMFHKVHEELRLILQPLIEDGIAVFQNEFGKVQGVLVCQLR